jgi:hypothetical protein
MALFGHGAMSDLSPLSGVKRRNFGAVRSVDDPTRTIEFGPIRFNGARWITTPGASARAST